MRKNIASQNIAGQMNSRTDGSPLTTGVTVYVTGDNGTQNTGGGTTTHKGNGHWNYAPTQAETNYNHIAFTFTHSTGVNQTVNVYTVGDGSGGGFNPQASVNPANVTQIDGQATSGNNATLNLKQLNIVNSTGDALIASSTGSNGRGIYAAGNGTGGGLRCVGGATGNGISAVGGGTSGAGIAASTTSGDGISASSGGGDGRGIYAAGNGAGAGMHSVGGGTGNGFTIVGGGTSGNGIDIAITSGTEVNAEFNDSSIAAIKAKTDNLPEGIKKNTALSNFEYLMLQTDHVTPATGLSWSAGDAQVSLDGAAFTNLTNTPTEVSNGIYKVNLAAADLNADLLTLLFKPTGADPLTITIKTVT